VRNAGAGDSISEHREDEKSWYQAECGDDHGMTAQAFVQHLSRVGTS
jgi:hypothetical protein